MANLIAIHRRDKETGELWGQYFTPPRKYKPRSAVLLHALQRRKRRSRYLDTVRYINSRTRKVWSDHYRYDGPDGSADR